MLNILARLALARWPYWVRRSVTNLWWAANAPWCIHGRYYDEHCAECDAHYYREFP